MTPYRRSLRAATAASPPIPGVIAERVTYGTSYGMRVPAIVYRPAQGGKHRPAW